MKEFFFKKPEKQHTEKYKYFSVPYIEIYYPTDKKVIKNYIIEPYYKEIK